jgi:hypothetical protein
MLLRPPGEPSNFAPSTTNGKTEPKNTMWYQSGNLSHSDSDNGLLANLYVSVLETTRVLA